MAWQRSKRQSLITSSPTQNFLSRRYFCRVLASCVWVNRCVISPCERHRESADEEDGPFLPKSIVSRATSFLCLTEKLMAVCSHCWLMTAICMLTIVFDSRAVLSLFFNEWSCTVARRNFFTSEKSGIIPARCSGWRCAEERRCGCYEPRHPTLFFCIERREPAGYPRHLGPPTHAGRWSDQRTTTG
jgi:hypothetical protein